MAKASDNKTVETKLSVAAFIDKIADPARRADAKTLAALMEKVTGFKPAMWGPAIVGFGSSHYKYESGREGDMPLISFSPRKAATVLYGLRPAESLLPNLGKYSSDGGCIRIKSLADVDEKVLQTMIEKSAKATEGKR